MNDVIYSSNLGKTWNLATAAAGWLPRSDGGSAVAPGTNYIVWAGGEGNNGYMNDIWLSSDGIGASWVLQTSNPGFVVFQQAPMTFMYDGQAVGGSNQYSTLVMYNPDDNNVYKSTNLGAAWSLQASMYVSGANPQQTGRMAADLKGFCIWLVGRRLVDRFILVLMRV